MTCSSILPATSTLNTPSTRSIAGSIRSSTIRCSEGTSLSPTMLSCSTGKVSLLIRVMIESSTPSGNLMDATLPSIVLSASSMSSPNSNVAMTRERFSEDVDLISFKPAMPEIEFSMGSETSRSTASGLADG